MEKEYLKQPIEVKLFCDECGEEMQYSEGNMLLSYPPKYLHICTKCGYKFHSTIIYPYIKYEDVEKTVVNQWHEQEHVSIKNEDVLEIPLPPQNGDVPLSDCTEQLPDSAKLCETSVYEQVKEEFKNKPLAFYLNENERKEYDLFSKEHKHCGCMGTIGGKISIIFTPTGLGDCITVKCNACGKEKEITDVSNW
jgi:DNA-directed RNA polymerase subunit M/transcription elongation factor TFIIS